MHRLVWLDYDGSAVVRMADGAVVTTRLERPGRSGRVSKTVPELASGAVLGHVVVSEEDAVLEVCEGCGECWGLRGSRGQTPGGRLLRDLLGSQRLLLHGAYPWRQNRPGYYCMGCSFPPR